jgi:hypothetical protein
MDAAGRYLELMKCVLTRTGLQENSVNDLRAENWMRHLLLPTQRLLAKRGYRLVHPSNKPKIGQVPANAETLIGIERLNNLQRCVESVLADGVPGDLIETGVWRGGATIFMRAVLAAYEVTDRTVWVADSFQGLPPLMHEADITDGPWPAFGLYAVSEEAVRANFARYGLLDDQVRFLVGWFKDTLPGAPIQQLAVARLDGDLYESTWDAITALYPKLSPGGFLIVDDYSYAPCAKAIHDYRTQHGIAEAIEPIDAEAVFWRKSP